MCMSVHNITIYLIWMVQVVLLVLDPARGRERGVKGREIFLLWLFLLRLFLLILLLLV